MCERIRSLFLSKGASEVELVHIRDVGLSNCTGCGSCFKKPGCVLRDGGDTLSEKVGAADGVVFASPVYASNVSGIMKTFIDRGHIVLEQLLYDTNVFHLVTFENAGAGDALGVLRKLTIFGGGIDRGAAKCKVGRDGRLIDERRTLETLDRKALRFYGKVMASSKIPLLNRLARWVIREWGIKPFIRGNERHGAVESLWRKRGWLKG
jgi:multimeric flavodoxin WrbA